MTQGQAGAAGPRRRPCKPDSVPAADGRDARVRGRGVAAAVTAKTGEVVRFEDVWTRRQEVALAGGQACVRLPSIDDLILTKKFALRPRDLEDIRLLEALKAGGWE